MPGGEIEVLTYGIKDKYIKGENSQNSFFIKKFSGHTIFSQEPISYPLDKGHLSFNEKQTCSIKVPRAGDLLAQTYLSVELPAIYSSREMAFRWIPYIGDFLFEKYQIRVGPSVIEERHNDLHHIWNELTHNIERYHNYNRMVGHLPSLYKPENATQSGLYPIGTKNQPSIDKQTLYIPLQFYFSDYSMAFPLIAAQHQDIEIKVTFRPLKKLYLLQQKNANNELEFLPPDITNKDHSIYRFLDPNDKKESKSQVNINQHILFNYIFLDSKEREFFAYNQLSYLIPQSKEYKTIIQGTERVKLPFNEPTKELIWFLRPIDYEERNGYIEYSNNGKHYMNKARLLVFNKDRIKTQHASYFNYIQPYEHHTSAPRDGIYVFSFALYPESNQPSGSFELGLVDNLELEIEPVDTINKYEVVVYALTYNVLNFAAGRTVLQW